MNDPVSLAVAFGKELEARDIQYALTGSVAASFYGEPRSTIDIDFTVMASSARLHRLVELRERFYVPDTAIEKAATQFGSFSLIDHASGIKIDIFVLDESPFNQLLMERRVEMPMPTGSVWVASPEDVTARKVRWYALTDETSERQYRDIMALMTYGNVDVDEVIATAELVGLGPLAERLAEEATSAETEEDNRR